MVTGEESMASKKRQPTTRKVIVDVDTTDATGNDITDDMLSSGGARRPDGSLASLYKNPTPYVEPEDNAEAREFYARLNAEYAAQLRHEEREAQAQRDREVREWVDFFAHLWKEHGEPAVKAYWAARGPDDVQRLKRLVAKPFRRGKAAEKAVAAEEPCASRTQELPEQHEPGEQEAGERPEGIIDFQAYRARREVSDDGGEVDERDSTSA